MNEMNEESEVCRECNGSGEGYYSNDSVCSKCNGCGTIKQKSYEDCPCRGTPEDCRCKKADKYFL